MRTVRLSPRPLPTTAAGAEVGLAIAFLGLRAVDLVQAAVTLPNGGLARSPRPGLYLLFTAVLLVESVLVGRRVVRRGRYDEPWLGLVDVAVGVLLLLATISFTRVGDRFTNWADWGYPVSLSMALGAGIAFRRWWHTGAAAAALTAAYLVTTLPALADGDNRTTAVSNAASYWAFAVVARLYAGYLRRLGEDADTARAKAAELARRAERDQHRLLLHDQASVLHLLAHEGLDERLAATARAQAATGAARIRRFLADEPARPGVLAAELRALGDEFGDLDPVVNVDLARDPLPPAVVGAVVSAVRALLHNVRRHAEAQQVVVHAETCGNGWEVCVRDDGRGFDPDGDLEGFGLATQVRRQLRDLGAHVDVRSHPGEGTVARLWGTRR